MLSMNKQIHISLILQPPPGDEALYDLFSVVIHVGGAYGGHYHAYIRDVDSLGTWTSPVCDTSLTQLNFGDFSCFKAKFWLT